ncbi:MAG: Na+/H+ antiporter subunit E [Anaerolineales bacterium]|jgi:multicomponent Na+:H+ antiporter subunit E|nr:Na+/H+ antiporter subunit E [Anaerolineales bacterium]
MNYFILNIILALTWAMLSGEINLTNLTAGFFIGYVILYIARRALGPSVYFSKVIKMVHFLGFFMKELLISNVRLAHDVLTWEFHMKPRIVAVPLSVKTDAEITVLANLISLTPGTLSLDVSSDKSALYVHVIYAEDEETAKREIKNGMERWVSDLSSQEKE